MNTQGLGALLIRDPAVGIEVVFKNDGTTMWVNIDGVCRLRVEGIPMRNDEFTISLVYPSSWKDDATFDN